MTKVRSDIENVYRLSPMQKGMLFHGLRDDAAEDIYIGQFTFLLEGDIDVPALRESLHALVRRHEVLRSSYVWKRVKEPRQLIHRDVTPDFVQQDWRTLSSHERERRREAWLHEDRRRRFDFARPPLIRFALLRMADDRYELVWTHHHLLMDAWSLVIALDDAQILYQAAARGAHAETNLPPPGAYSGYAAWVQRQDDERGAAYWAGMLDGFTSPTPLVLDAPGAHEPASSGFLQCDRQLSSALTAALRQLAQRNRLTLNTLVQGAWALLLCRYCGETDVVFGVTVSGRPPEVPGIERLVGNFISTLPLRVRVRPDARLVPWLAQLQQSQLDVGQHSFCYLGEIQKASGVLPGVPLFESLVVFENYPVQARDQGAQTMEIRIEARPYEGRTNYPLTLAVGPRGDLLLSLLYDSGRFARPAIERMLLHLESLLEQMTVRTESTLSELEAMPAAERQRFVVDFNMTERVHPAEGALHELIEAQAARTPDAPAIVADDGELTYREANAQANRIAAVLVETGSGIGGCVAVLLPRNRHTIPAVLGIVKAGAAYVPLDLAWPPSRIAAMLAELEVTAILTDESAAPVLDAVARAYEGLRTVICLDGALVASPGIRHVPAADVQRRAAENVARPISLDHVAYVIFTSGSTGTPKGVMVAHRSVVNFIEWRNTTFGIGPGDRMLFVTALTFDLSVYDIFGTLAAGASVRVVSEADRHDGRRLASMLLNEPATMWHSAPPVLQQVTPYLPSQPARTNGLRLVFLSGDWLPLPLAGRLMRAFPGVEVISEGGATETTINGTWFAIGDIDPAWVSIPYGRPIDNARAYVLDAGYLPCPVGVPGDLFIGGQCLAIGYARQPHRTAERFLPDPFAGSGGQRMYWTGDRARYMPSGAIEFLGRRDRQVKVRGFRVELGEIDAALGQHSAVQQAVTVTQDVGPGDTRLVAYFTPKDSVAAPVASLLRWQRDGRMEGLKLFDLPNGGVALGANAHEVDFLVRLVFQDRAYCRHGITIEDGDRVVDVGANVGFFSLFAARAAEGVQVYACEPIPQLCRVLEMNAALAESAIRVVNCGIAERSGTDSFIFYPHVSLVSGRKPDRAQEHQAIRGFLMDSGDVMREHPAGSDALDELIEARLDAVTVPCEIRTLSQLLREQGLDRVDLLKINAERSEEDVLEGIDAGDWHRIRQVVLEVHDQAVRDRIVERLQQRGYHVLCDQIPYLAGAGLWNVYAARSEPRAQRTVQTCPARSAFANPRSLIAAMRAHLRERLPEYMMPSALIPVAEFPITGNGKIDRAALPSLAPGWIETEVPEGERPRSETELALAEIWREVLGVDQVGVNDSFFDIGGDSILSLQVNARAHERGLRLTPRQVFEHRTIAALARVAEAQGQSGVPEVEQDAPALSAGQQWFFERVPGAPAHWNQAVRVEVTARLDRAALEAAVAGVAARHDALRQRFAPTADGWQTWIAAGNEAPPVSVVDATRVDAGRRAAVLAACCTQVQQSLHLARGPVWRVVVLEAEPTEVLVVAHHLVIDTVSLGLVLEALERHYAQAMRGETVARGARGSIGAWVRGEVRAAATAAATPEVVEAWLRRARAAAEADRGGPAGVMGAARTVTETLSEPATRAVLEEAVGGARARLDEVLLMVLASAVERCTGERTVGVMVEEHGRDEGSEAATVGCLARRYPSVLTRPAGADWEGALAAVKDQLRSGPAPATYGQLRYLGPVEVRDALAAAATPGIAVTYLGVLDAPLRPSGLFRRSAASPGPARSAEAPLADPVELTGAVIGHRLQLSWTYADGVAPIAEPLLHAYSEVLRDFVDHCQHGMNPVQTLDDVAIFGWTQDDLDRIAVAVDGRGAEQ